MKNKLTWAFSIAVAFIFAQSLVFKLSGAEETTIIFSTIASWMTDIGLPNALSDLFKHYGAYAIAFAESAAVAMILMPKTRTKGATLSLTIISGAIFFHLFTPLGVDRVIDLEGNTDGGALFYTACFVALASVIVLILNRNVYMREKDMSLQHA